MDLPSISTIIHHVNGRRQLEACLSSLMAVAYPSSQHEQILVDNESNDGSPAAVRALFPQVRLIQNTHRAGWAAGRNRAAQAAAGDFLVFLDSDTVVAPDFLTELLRPCLAEAGVVSTAPRVVYEGSGDVAPVASAASYFGFTYDRPVDADAGCVAVRSLLFAPVGAMLVRRDVFLACGGFDEDYRCVLEDLDLGWRLWLMGHRVVLAPAAQVNRSASASAAALAEERLAALRERNALATLYKNYDEENLRRVLPAALLMMFKRAERAAMAGGWSPASYSATEQSSSELTDVVPRAALAPMVAAGAIVDALPAMGARRAAVQARRRRCDAEILRLFGDPLRLAGSNHAALDEGYARAGYTVARELGVSALFAGYPRRVLVVSGDVLPLPGLPTTGAGLRAWSLGQGLRSRGHTVVFSMPRAVLKGRSLADQHDPILNLLWEPGRLDEVIARAQPDVVLACGWFTAGQMTHCLVPVVVDQHGPHMMERSYQKHQDEETNAAEKLRGLARADYFICAGERQHKYFLPWLARAGFDDPERQSSVIPVSLGGEWPLPAPAQDGEVTFVYGGVFLPWQDPSLALTTLVQRMEALGRGRLRLFGGRHPFIPIDTREFDRLTAVLGQSQRVEISPMLEHDALLREYRRAHVAIDLMRKNPERELAFTTRTVEYLWCGLPVIYNDYSELSDYIQDAGAGWCLDPEDVAGMAAVFDQILLHPEVLTGPAQQARRLAEERLNWEQTIEPLDQFCRQPYRRADRPIGLAQPDPAGGARRAPSGSTRWLFGEAARHYRRGGLRVLAYETLEFLQRQMGGPR